MGKRRSDLLKQPGLADFAREIKAGIIVREDVRTVIAAHPVKGFTAPLREDDSLSPGNGGAIFIIWQPTCAQNVFVGYNIRVK
jgi:hypothetical protein